MATFPPNLDEVLRSLQRQIDEIVMARPGPMSFGPGDGHLRFYTPDGDTFMVAATGAQLRYRGSLRDLTGLTESFATSIEDHTKTLGDHIRRLNGIDGRLDGHDSTLSSHGTRLGSAESRLSGHDSAISAHNTRINNAQNAANAAQSRADSAYSRASTAITNAATAQSRADAAHSLASSRASSGDVSAAVTTAKQYTDSRINALVTALRNQGIPIAL